MDWNIPIIPEVSKVLRIPVIEVDHDSGILKILSSLQNEDNYTTVPNYVIMGSTVTPRADEFGISSWLVTIYS